MPQTALLFAQLREQRTRVLLLTLVTLLAVRLGFGTFSPRTAVGLVQHGGYAVMLGTFAWFGWLLWRAIRWRSLSERLRAGGWKIVLLIAVVSAVLHMQEEHGFKVVNDELVQLSTSQRMHAERDASRAARGYPLGTEFVLMQGEVDKRPLFFPFLLSVVHDLRGYRVENAFLLNAVLTPVLFGLLYLVACRLSGRGGGIAAVVLLATAPLVTQVATGGGFELLNLVMILAVVYLGFEYAERPTETTLGAFCLAGVLLAQVRYESVLFVLPVAVAVGYVTYTSRRLLLPWTVLLAPLLLVVYPLQLNVLKLNAGLWQLSDRPSEHGVYSLSYLYDNVGRAIRFFFEWDHSQANSHLVAVAGLLGVGFFWMWLYRHYRELRDSPTRMVFTLFVLTLCAQAVLMLCYFWGAFDESITVRLSLPMHVLFVLTFVFVYPELLPRAWGWRALGIGGAVYLWLWTLPTLTRRSYAHENLAAETCNWHREYLAERPDRDFLVIEPQMPLLWITHRVPAVSFDVLAARASEFLFHYRQKTFRDWLVVQKLVITDFQSGELAPVLAFDFGPAVTLETVREMRFTPTYVIRMSRIVSVDEPRFLEWATMAKAETETERSAARTEPRDDARKLREAEFTEEWLRKLP